MITQGGRFSRAKTRTRTPLPLPWARPLIFEEALHRSISKNQTVKKHCDRLTVPGFFIVPLVLSPFEVLLLCSTLSFRVRNGAPTCLLPKTRQKPTSSRPCSQQKNKRDLSKESDQSPHALKIIVKLSFMPSRKGTRNLHQILLLHHMTTARVTFFCCVQGHGASSRHLRSGNNQKKKGGARWGLVRRQRNVLRSSI